MEDTYKGESPSKKNARFMYWSEVMKHMENNRFFNSHHMILASREGGDISTLSGLGVLPNFIVAVERNPEAAYAVQEKYPSVRVVCSDAVKIAKEYRRKLSSVYLDFCGSLTPKLLNDIIQVAQHGLRDDAILGVTILSGREKGDMAEAVEHEKERMTLKDEKYINALSNEDVVRLYNEMSKSRKHKDTHLQSFYDETSALLATMDAEGMAAFANRMRKRHHEGHETAASAIARMHFLSSHLRETLGRFRVVVHPVSLISYVSMTDTSKGVPMAISLLRLQRLAKTMPLDKFHRKSTQLCIEWGFPHVIDATCTLRDLRRDVLGYIRWVENQANKGKISLDTAKYVTSKAGALWNIDKETIIAWKAHETRGTYG
jgi:hypothetical protein